MDKNGNGRIDPDEIDERRANFFRDRFQIDFSKPVEIEAIKQRFQQAAESRSRERGGGDSQRGQQKKEEVVVKDSYKVDGSAQAKGRKSYRSEGRSLPKALPSWWDDRDDDQDGQITLSEFASTADDRIVSEFQDFDTNGDGLITAREAEVVESED